MNKHNCERQFYHLSEAWYGKDMPHAPDVVDDVMVGFFHKDGGTTGEFSIEWTLVGGRSTPRLCAFEDAWDALWQFRDVLEQLAKLDGTNPTPETVCAVLESCGVKDATPRENPNKAKCGT